MYVQILLWLCPVDYLLRKATYNKSTIDIHQIPVMCFTGSELSWSCKFFSYAAILQCPIGHNKRPPKHGYKRTKINRKLDLSWFYLLRSQYDSMEYSLWSHLLAFQLALRWPFVKQACSEKFFFLEHAGDLRINILRRKWVRTPKVTGFVFLSGEKTNL